MDGWSLGSLNLVLCIEEVGCDNREAVVLCPLLQPYSYLTVSPVGSLLGLGRVQELAGTIGWCKQCKDVPMFTSLWRRCGSLVRRHNIRSEVVRRAVGILRE